MAITTPGINTQSRWELALKTFHDASALIMQGNLLVGVIDNTGDGYLAVPIKFASIARYEKGSAAELKAYAARFPEAHRFAPYQELLEEWLEGDGYDCIPATLEAMKDQFARSAYEPGIMLVQQMANGREAQVWVDKKPPGYQTMLSARSSLLIDGEGKLITFDRSVVGWWDYKTLWMLYRHSKDMVIRLPLDNHRMEKIARSLLESPLTFWRWADGFSAAQKQEWEPGLGPIQHWLSDALGCNPVVTAETVAINGVQIPTPSWVLPTPFWVLRAISAERTGENKANFIAGLNQEIS